MITTVKIGFDTTKFERYLNRTVNKQKKLAESYVKEIIRDTFRYAANSIIPREIAKYAPTHAQEEQALIRGRSEKGAVGDLTDKRGRFIKAPQFTYVKEAIKQFAKFSIRSQDRGNIYRIIFTLAEDSRKKISDAIGFGWIKNIGTIRSPNPERRSTLDRAIWSNLLNLWEDGGSYIVRPRESDGFLRPGPGKKISVKQIRKTIPPFQMFKKGLMSARPKIRKIVEQKLRARYGAK